MAMQAVQIAAIGEVPNNGDRSARWLWVPRSQSRDSFDDAQHAFTDQRIIQQAFGRSIVNVKVRKEQADHRHQGS